MENLLNTSNPIIALFYTIIVVMSIYVARKFEKTILPATVVATSIILLITHVIRINGNDFIGTTIPQTYICVAFDLIILLLGFISYLWIDDIVAKKKKLKSYDNSLAWFWEKL